jgi:dihydrofolate synthase/folylpolyglutamate synthase
VLLLGILADKDVAAMVAALAPLARAVVVTEPPWEGRMGQAHAVAHAAERYLPDVIVVSEVGAAFAAAQQRARELGGPLVVTGSLILVGAVRALVHGRR